MRLIFAQAMLSENNILISKYSRFTVFQVAVSSTISHDYVVLFLSVGLIPSFIVHSVLDIDPALEKSLLWLALLNIFLIACGMILCSLVSRSTNIIITNTVPSQKRAHYGMSAHPPLWAQFPAKV